MDQVLEYSVSLLVMRSRLYIKGVASLLQLFRSLIFFLYPLPLFINYSSQLYSTSRRAQN